MAFLHIASPCPPFSACRRIHRKDSVALQPKAAPMDAAPTHLHQSLTEEIRKSARPVTRDEWPRPAAEGSDTIENVFAWADHFWADHGPDGVSAPYRTLEQLFEREPARFEQLHRVDAADVYDSLRDVIVEEGKAVFQNAWERGGPKPAAGVESVLKWGGCYWSHDSEGALRGPCATLDAALFDGATYLAPITRAIDCTEWGTEKVLSRLWTQGALDHEFLLNHEPWYAVDKRDGEPIVFERISEADCRGRSKP